MKNKHLLAIFILGLISFSACRNTENINAATSDSTIEQRIPDTATVNRGGDVSAFMQEAATESMMKLALGNLAAQKSTNKQIKRLAGTIVKDHTKLEAELKALAASKSIALPSTLPAADLKHIEELKKMDVAAFEKHYIDMMLKDNAAAIDVFKAASVSGDAKIRTFSTKSLRMSERHFKRAGDIKASPGY